ncbi:MAG TPA: hypothetical protein VN703_00265 [Candidatus Sulfopaludibacter sp.]|nr:hypothetical protein [Candidatus Sulfopaludibacter sp.]
MELIENELWGNRGNIKRCDYCINKNFICSGCQVKRKKELLDLKLSINIKLVRALFKKNILFKVPVDNHDKCYWDGYSKSCICERYRLYWDYDIINDDIITRIL